jgi:hypothetical protein
MDHYLIAYKSNEGSINQPDDANNYTNLEIEPTKTNDRTSSCKPVCEIAASREEQRQRQLRRWR